MRAERITMLGMLGMLALLGSCRTVPAELPIDGSAEPSRTNPVFAEADPPDREPATGVFGLVSDSITELYGCWFRNPYDYMFRYEDPVDVGGRQYGMMMAGVRGILFYGNFNGCAGELVGTEPSNYADLGPIEALAGVPATVDAPHLRFSAVNPEFIAFARRNWLPHPEQLISGVPTQTGYDRVFQRFFRLQAASLLTLLEITDIDREVTQYLDDTNAGADGIEWLEARYQGRIAGFDDTRDYSTMTPSMAAGFWLRRRADGSFAASWYGLRDVLMRYDGYWLGEQLDAYPKAAATLDQLADPLGSPLP